MSEILNELQEVKKATQEQTAASQAQTAEVAGKMAQIDQKVASAQKEFDDFISGDFDRNVASARTITVFIDPVDGDDSNSGSIQAQPIKSSTRLHQLVGTNIYQWVSLYFRKGTVFDLEHIISARDFLQFNSYAGSDNSSVRPIVNQNRPNNAVVYAQRVHLYSVDVNTYQAVANEELPNVYSNRALFGDTIELSFVFSKATLIDNQLIHLHTGGSGERFVRHTISFYHSTVATQASANSVVGSNKRVVTFYATRPAFPFDIFGVGFSTDYHDAAETHASVFNIIQDGVLTNLPLFPSE